MLRLGPVENTIMASQFEVLVVGTGLAGLTAALHLADHRRVGLVTKATVQDTASRHAQGGIAAVTSPDDAIELHVQDTMVAGAGLCDERIVQHVVEKGPGAIEWLLREGMQFTADPTSPTGYHLTTEGGHSRRRVTHVADATGDAIQRTLTAKVHAHPNITVLEQHAVVDLITGSKLGLGDNHCYGCHALHIPTGRIVALSAAHTVLATGGAGKAYLYTTNPDTSTGDGIAIGWRAGCRVANMEFIQFHPTCLYHPLAKSFLVSEAVRGEGGLLTLPDGTRFMPSHDERAELAPRDVVARAIDFEMKKHGLECVHLDITHRPPDFIEAHFPTILRRCLELGIDITRQPIPVVPAAHYTCGGLVVDEHGRTDISRLYAIGETTCTGLHGANRLASNSLLECLVFGHAAALDILSQPRHALLALPEWDETQVEDPDEQVVISHNWDELRRFMWNYVGIVRTTKRLERALNRIRLLQEEIQDFYAHFRVNGDLLELRNLATVAELIVRCALLRRESRGLHFNKDYPGLLPVARNTILVR
jgi:L-aspartate oxidase